MRERMVAGEVLPPFLAALAFMHANSIVHRDIKPENILLTADRSIKVGGVQQGCSRARTLPPTASVEPIAACTQLACTCRTAAEMRLAVLLGELF